ncbi:DEAD/DEAH box helicase [Candidatus Desantisbacteria bacterium]|nr:DEAD/DEAH box helicase [Candidatus Desantisbacteria bacterium]
MNQELNVIILSDGFLELEWQDKEEQINNGQLLLQKELYKHYNADFDSFLLFLGFCDNSVSLSVSLNYFRKLTGLFTKALIQTPDLEALRNKINITPSEDEIAEILNAAPFMPGAEYLNKTFLENIFAKMNAKYKQGIKAFKGPAEEFVKTYSPDAHLAGRVFFHLVESKKEEYPFAFLATYSTNLNKQGKSKHLPLKYAMTEYAKDNQKLLELLKAVHLAAKESNIISGFLETGEIFHPLALSVKEAFNILKEIPAYEKSGILCRIPNWWKNKTAGLTLQINIGNKRPSSLGMDSILDFNLGLFLGDTSITEEDAKRLLNESEGLAFIKGKWVEVDPEKLKKTLEAYEKAEELMKKDNLSLKDALRLQLDLQKNLELRDDEIVSVSNGDWLKSVIEKLRNPELLNSITPGEGFKGELRPYQQKGLNWLYFLYTLQFGACLADDMGLGKTIQLLALLNVIKKDKASLLIIPASLISNWVNEINHFAPAIKYYIAHPSQDKSMEGVKIDENFLNKFDIVITTYSLTKKYIWINDYKWNYVILDEAQAIKNPGTEQAKAVKKISCNNRIIMTGTPIENRLSDLWSLFDFLNPGLLGSVNEFSSFIKDLKSDLSRYAKLKKIINPYILRRLKTDKTVISDLPDKVEMKVYSYLSKKQIVLYSNLVKELKEKLENETEGINRKGLILASLMKFKQLCNHPDQYLGRDEYQEEDSGKYLRLREICETIYEKREKVLIFTQFREISEPLKEYLKTIFNHDGLMLHGGTPVNKRKEIVEKFQSHEYVPFMVLTIKAGGVGLNLTAANHVIHFDRWWNPAVESQATDRVFRIGQKKNVIVHKFITKGTIEEKIDAMLEEKSDLSDNIIQKSNETWITEMDNDKLMNLFKLSL